MITRDARPSITTNYDGQVRNDSAEAGSGTVLVAVGDSFESANAAVMYHARGLVSTADRAGEYSTELETLSDNVEANWYENWYDGLGYCEL